MTEEDKSWCCPEKLGIISFSGGVRRQTTRIKFMSLMMLNYWLMIVASDTVRKARSSIIACIPNGFWPREPFYAGLIGNHGCQFILSVPWKGLWSEQLGMAK